MGFVSSPKANSINSDLDKESLHIGEASLGKGLRLAYLIYQVSRQDNRQTDMEFQHK